VSVVPGGFQVFAASGRVWAIRFYLQLLLGPILRPLQLEGDPGSFGVDSPDKLLSLSGIFEGTDAEIALRNFVSANNGKEEGDEREARQVRKEHLR
jgi:hypothetical protein